MITVSKYRQLFQNKLAATDSFDDAFTKAVWVAYTDGYAAGVDASKFDSIPALKDAESEQE